MTAKMIGADVVLNNDRSKFGKIIGSDSDAVAIVQWYDDNSVQSVLYSDLVWVE